MIFKLNDGRVKLTCSLFNDKLTPSLWDTMGLNQSTQFAYMQQLTLGFPDLHQKDYCRILQEQMQRIMDQCQRLHMVVIWTQTMQMIDEVALHIKIGHNVYIKGTLLWRCIIPSCTLLLMMLFFEIFIQHVVWTIIVRLQN